MSFRAGDSCSRGPACALVYQRKQNGKGRGATSCGVSIESEAIETLKICPVTSRGEAPYVSWDLCQGVSL
jgi:hypothetical protein